MMPRSSSGSRFSTGPFHCLLVACSSGMSRSVTSSFMISFYFLQRPPRPRGSSCNFLRNRHVVFLTVMLRCTPLPMVCKLLLHPRQHLMSFILVILISSPQLAQDSMPDEGSGTLYLVFTQKFPEFHKRLCCILSGLEDSTDLLEGWGSHSCVTSFSPGALGNPLHLVQSRSPCLVSEVFRLGSLLQPLFTQRESASLSVGHLVCYPRSFAASLLISHP